MTAAFNGYASEYGSRGPERGTRHVPLSKNHRIRLIYSSELEGFGLRNDTWWRPSHSLSASKTAGSLLALLWVLLGTLGVSVSLDTNSASMPHMCELGFETPGDKV